MQNSSSEYLIRAACLLSRLHEVSPSNFKAMLMTVKIFHWMGFLPNASQVFDMVDPKYIQYDSLGYLHSALLAPFSWSQTTVERWYSLATRFFMFSARESVDYLAMSYRTGTFSKLQELLDFRDRLTNSLQHHLILVESALLELVWIKGSAHSINFPGVQQVRNLNINPEHRVPVKDLMDNRDLEVVIRWDPVVVNDFDDETTRERKHAAGLEFVREQSFKEQVLLLRTRKTLLNLVVAQVNGLTGHLHHGKQYGDGTIDTKESGPDFVAVLRTLQSEWTELFGSVADVQRTHYQETYLVNRMLSQLHFVTQVPYQSFMDAFTNFTLAIMDKGRTDGGVDIATLGDLVVANIKSVVELVRCEVKRHSEAEDAFWTYRKSLETAASAVELLALATTIVAVLEKRPVKAGKNAGAKKSQGSQSSTEWDKAKQATVQSIAKCLKEQLAGLETILGEFRMKCKNILSHG